MSDRDRATCRMLYVVGGPGNAERVDVSDLFARRLAASDFDVDYVIYGLHENAAWRQVEWRGARAWVVGRSRKGGLAGALISKMYEALADIRVFWASLRRGYDVVQVRDKFVVGVLGLLACRLRGRLFTYWMSYPFADCRIVDGREGNSRFPLASIVGGHCAKFLLYKVILPHADHVFVQSEQMKKDVAEEGVPNSKMTPVPMAVSESLLDVASAGVDEKTVLYLGTLVRVRRLDTLLDAMKIVLAQHPSARLFFVGDGDSPEDRAFLERRAKELGIDESVVFTGMLPMAEAHAYVSRSAVCLSPFYPIPILLSTSPTKISEYMALGRPVVANAHPEQSRIIEQSGAGYCVEWSAEEFARAIVKLLDDPFAAEEMGERGRAYVRANRTYGVVAPRVASVYRQLLAERALQPVRR